MVSFRGELSQFGNARLSLFLLFAYLLILAMTIFAHYNYKYLQGSMTNFEKFTGKHMCQSLSFNKVAGLGRQLY